MTEFSEEEMLKDLQARARALPREIEPPMDAWSAIKAEIEKPMAPVSLPQAQRFWQRPAFLAAAGLLLVVGTSLVTVAVVPMKDSTSWRLKMPISFLRPKRW